LGGLAQRSDRFVDGLEIASKFLQPVDLGGCHPGEELASRGLGSRSTTLRTVEDDPVPASGPGDVVLTHRLIEDDRFAWLGGRALKERADAWLPSDPGTGGSPLYANGCVAPREP